jgi:hypothetical protein
MSDLLQQASKEQPKGGMGKFECRRGWQRIKHEFIITMFSFFVFQTGYANFPINTRVSL